MSQNMPSARAGHTKTPSYVPNSLRYKNMEYRRCGKSGILLPPLSLGLWKNFGSESDFDTCLQILHTAFDHGITHLDLANNYGPPYGSAELTLGKAMETSLRLTGMNCLSAPRPDMTCGPGHTETGDQGNTSWPVLTKACNA